MIGRPRDNLTDYFHTRLIRNVTILSNGVNQNNLLCSVPAAEGIAPDAGGGGLCQAPLECLSCDGRTQWMAFETGRAECQLVIYLRPLVALALHTALSSTPRAKAVCGCTRPV